MNQNWTQQPKWGELQPSLILQVNKEHNNVHFQPKNNISNTLYLRVMLIIVWWQTVQFGSWRGLSPSGIVLGRILSKGPSHNQSCRMIHMSRPMRRLGCDCWPIRSQELPSPNGARFRIKMSTNTVQSVCPSINSFISFFYRRKTSLLWC